jgi:hypothetical protein
MIKKLLICLAVLVVGFLIVVATRPPEFRVSRSQTLSAPAETLFEHVNDHHKFNVWNPFLKLDPDSKITYTGPGAGVGAVCSWDGNKDVGAGSCTIIESKPAELVRSRMDWLRPMTGTATVEFTFKPAGEGKTEVTWAMYGKNNFVAKAVSIFMDCDKMCGPQFEKGLVALEEVATSAAALTGPHRTIAP